MITPIEVLDTALKMGLGATISGLVTYLVTKTNHKAERAQRKSDLLEGILERVVKFDRAANHFSEDYSSWLETKPTDEDPLPEWLNQRGEKFFESYQEDMKMAEAKLILLGQEKCRQLLNDYVTFVRDHLMEALKKDGLKQCDAQRKKKRENFYEEVSRAYLRINRI